MLEQTINFFDNFEDPRIDRKKLYLMSKILLTTLCAVISGAEGWQFAKQKNRLAIFQTKKRFIVIKNWHIR